MQIKHQAAADPDSPVGTTALIHGEYTFGLRVTFDEKTGEASLDAPLPDDYRELQELAKLWGIDASQSEPALREALADLEGIPDEIGEQLTEQYEDIVPVSDSAVEDDAADTDTEGD